MGVSMKFKKEAPQKSGFYWYMDINYYEPSIGYISGSIFRDNGYQYDLESKYFKEFIRFGDRINMPTPEDMEIED